MARQEHLRRSGEGDEPARDHCVCNGGPNTRTTQLFINLKDNPQLDKRGFSPFGEVVSGMNVVDELYPGTARRRIKIRFKLHGNAYLQKQFPQLDYIKTARDRTD